MRNFLIVLVGVFAVAQSAAQSVAQVPISMLECRELALLHSEELQVADAQLQSSATQIRSLKRGAMPSLTTALGANYTVGNPLGAMFDARDYGYSAKLRLGQVIYGGNSVNASVRAARASRNVEALSAIATSQSVQHTADKHYCQLMMTTQQLGVQERYLQIIESLKNLVQARFEEGYVPRTDVLMVQSNLNQAKMQLIAAQEAQLLAQQQLNALFANVDFVEYVPTDTLSVPAVVGAEYGEKMSVDTAALNRADYLAALGNVELQSALQKSVASAYNPTLQVSFEGNYGTPMMNVVGSKSQLYGVAQLSFTATLFNFGKRSLEVQQQRWQRHIAQVEATQTKADIASQLHQAHIQLQNRYAQCQLNAQNLRDANQNLELVTFSYTEGRLTILDVLQAQVGWASAYALAIGAMYEYGVAEANLRSAAGMY